MTVRLPAGVGGLLVLLSSALLLAGCAGPRGEVPDAERASEVACAADGSADAPREGRIPAGFEPVAVYRCDTTALIENREGRWSGITIERFEGDLGPVLAALNEPDEPRWPGPCTAIGVIVQPLWLVDADGTAVQVTYPVTGCGLPRTDGVFAALEALELTERRSEPRELLESRAALEAGCPTRWMPLQIVTPEKLEESGVPGLPQNDSSRTAPDDSAVEPPAGGRAATLPAPPAALPPASEIDTMRLCRYSTRSENAPPAQLDTNPDVGAGVSGHIEQAGLGWFVGSRELDTARARALTTAIDAADELVGPCSEKASEIVLLIPNPGSATASGSVAVELDGCRGILRLGSATSRATDEVLHLIEPGD